MPEFKVAATLITGDAYKDEEVQQTLKSLEGSVHKIFVNYNGKKGKLNWQKWTDIPLTYKKFKWEDNFSKARQQSFSLVPKDEFDYIIWLDTDDILVVNEGTSMQEMLESLDEYTSGIFLRYAYAVEPETGIVAVEQWRERVLSTKVDWVWHYLIHEVCQGPNGTQFAKRDNVFIEHLRRSGDERGARERNRRIISKALREEPDEPRHMFYFASETLAEADAEPRGPRKLELIEAALLAFEQYRQMVNTLTDDVYLATARMAELARMKGDHSQALQYDMECVALYPDWPDAYVGAAKSCMELGDWPRMKAFADMAMKCPKPQTAASIEPMMAGFTPVFLRGIANKELGNFDQSMKDFKKARKIWNPPNGALDEEIKSLKTKFNKDDDSDRWNERKKYRGTKPEKSICFFTQPIPETWHPETLKEGGCGGAETCIMELAPRFAADGWRVAVFGTPGEHRGVTEDGVEYWNSDEFLPNEKFSVFISSRSPVPFTTELSSAVNLLWMHDVNIGEGLGPVKDKPDAVIGLTNWHKNHLSKLYGIPLKRLEVVPNGINLDRYPVSEWDNESSPTRFIWSSSPDRGLDTLLSMWPVIREHVPDAELHIYYGWGMIEKMIAISRQSGQPNRWLENFQGQVLNQIDILGGESGGVYSHGRVNQDELAKQQMKSLVWPYPTSFMETFCITAIESQAAGVIPVTSNLAALSETVSNPNLMIEGWPMNSDYQQRWLQILAAVMEDKEARIEQRQIGRKHSEKFTWNNAYNRWNELFIKMGVRV